MPPKDARVKSLWNLLRQRQLLARSPWLQRVLQHIWQQGLGARVRPKTARRMARVLRRWAVLPPRPGAPGGAGAISISVQPGTQARLVPLRRVVGPGLGPRRPIVVRPVRPVAVRPIARPTGRR